MDERLRRLSRELDGPELIEAYLRAGETPPVGVCVDNLPYLTERTIEAERLYRLGCKKCNALPLRERPRSRDCKSCATTVATWRLLRRIKKRAFKIKVKDASIAVQKHCRHPSYAVYPVREKRWRPVARMFRGGLFHYVYKCNRCGRFALLPEDKITGWVGDSFRRPTGHSYEDYVWCARGAKQNEI